jgi:hypothetical protein
VFDRRAIALRVRVTRRSGGVPRPGILNETGAHAGFVVALDEMGGAVTRADRPTAKIAGGDNAASRPSGRSTAPDSHAHLPDQ